jgi:hypothetical protein
MIVSQQFLLEDREEISVAKCRDEDSMAKGRNNANVTSQRPCILHKKGIVISVMACSWIPPA